MRPRLLSGPGLLLLICVVVGNAYGDREIDGPRRHDEYDFGAGKRTFLFGKLVLVPVLAAVGLKFLALLPIVLSKIALLSVMNFLSTNLNLLVSTLFGLKNFLGKHGLWAQDDAGTTIKHPDIETFAEFANQPIIQPSFRYQYVMDREPIMGRIEAAKPMKLTNTFGGFVPSDPGSYKYMFDRRTRANDRKQLLKAKEQRSNGSGGGGKYKCYWTSEESDTGIQFTPDSPVIKQEFLKKRKYDVADTPRIKQQAYTRQLAAIRELSNSISPSADSYVPQSNFYDYRSYINGGTLSEDNPIYRQVATHGSAEKIDDNSSIRDVATADAGDGSYGQLPFTTDDQVKVAENYGTDGDGMMLASTQLPLMYLLRQVETTTATTSTTTAKFKDEEVEN